jgi:hypothetical protein
MLGVANADAALLEAWRHAAAVEETSPRHGAPCEAAEAAVTAMSFAREYRLLPRSNGPCRDGLTLELGG